MAFKRYNAENPYSSAPPFAAAANGGDRIDWLMHVISCITPRTTCKPDHENITAPRRVCIRYSGDPGTLPLCLDHAKVTGWNF